MTEIIVLTGKVCSLCNSLKKGLNDIGIHYKAVEMTDTEGMGLVILHGVKSIPQVFIDGKLLPRNKYKEVLGVSID